MQISINLQKVSQYPQILQYLNLMVKFILIQDILWVLDGWDTLKFMNILLYLK